MELTESQIALLQNKEPFEVMLWLDENKISSLPEVVCCAIRVPRKLSFKDFAIIFDNLKVTDDNDKQAELRYHVIYLFNKAFRRHFKYVFNLEEPGKRRILVLLGRRKGICIYGYRVMKEGTSVLVGKKQQRLNRFMRDNANKVLESYAAIERQKTASDKVPAKNGKQRTILSESLDDDTKIKELVTDQRGAPYTLPNDWQSQLTHISGVDAPEDRQTVVKNKVVLEEKVFSTGEKQPVKHSLPRSLPLIERCIYEFRQGNLNGKQTWSLLLAAGLEHARLFTWEKEALALLEHKRQTIHKSQRPVISPPFPSPYVWFEFTQPLETPICKDTAAMYLFSAASDILYRSAVFRSLSEPEFTQWKRKNVYGSEQERLSILIINTHGELVWSMSLPTTYDEGNKHEQRPWLTPPWYSCPQRRCKMFAEQQKDGTRGLYWELCPACKEAQIFFSTWVMTAWQALLGEYRTVPDREEVLDRIGTRQAGYKPVVEGYAWLRSGRVRTYTQLITYKDISQTLKSWHDVLHPRGSWVEALMKIDPELVTKKEQRVSEHTRRYTSPRFTNMQGQETIIPSFTRKSPVRADLMNVPRKTDVVAKNGKENVKKRRK